MTHVIRGDDHIENTYRHIALYQALGADVPKFSHLPMIINAQGKPYSKRDGAAFEASAVVGTGVGNQIRPSIAIDSSNRLFVCWQDSRRDEWDIFVRTSDDGAAWNPIVMVNTGTGPDQTWPAIAVAGNGNAYIAWQDDSSGDSEIYARRWNGTRWEEIGVGSATGGGAGSF